jgi:hypothetical protein
MMLRRRLLSAGLAGSVVGFGACRAARADSSAGPLSAVIEYSGKSYRYAESEGTDLGDYVDPQRRFVQRCVVANNKQFPLTLFFRPDRTSDRAEVVFELGRIWPSEPPANLESYRVTIHRGDKVVFQTDVPQHYWFSRWRWQSAPRPPIVSVSELLRKGLLPPYDERAHSGPARQTRPQTYQIMELAGIYRAMGATGERPDIGPVTEQQAEFICTGRSGALDTVLAQAEGAGTLPWHFRDEHTGAPLDTLRYKRATVYRNDEAPAGDPFIERTKLAIKLDSAHQPALAYLPFLLTGDPYYLETLQFQVTFNTLEGPPDYRYRTGQVRAVAWTLRTLGQAAMVTPENTPRWLLPKSNLSEQLKLNRDWIMREFVSSADVPRSIFHVIDQSFGGEPDKGLEAKTRIAPWQDDFLTFVLLWLVQMGHASWEPIARWKAGSTIARTDGKSGWIRAHATPYSIGLREHRDSPWLPSWSAAWQLTAARLNLVFDDPNRLAITKAGQLTYPAYTRGALVMASRLGIAEAKPCYEWIDGELRRALAALRGSMDYKWSVA